MSFRFSRQLACKTAQFDGEKGQLLGNVVVQFASQVAPFVLLRR